MNKTTNTLKAIAFAALSLVGMTANAQPAVGSNGYQAWKQSLITPGSNSAPVSSNSINPPTGSAPGCYFAPDASYTSLAGNDDGSTGSIALPFTFNLYGTAYTSCFINNNGNITFTNSTSQFSAAGFPTGTALTMVAPFWADVDTRIGATLQYKVESNRLIATWPGVGYFNQQTGLLNTFQVIISNGTDPGIGLGNNVAFYYGDMQWTTGSASSGVGGFGGVPATVGINAGNSVDYVQIGRFNVNDASYDGGGGANDGVNYLDYECFTFNATGSGGSNNLPPSVSGVPAGSTITIPQGSTATLNLTFLPPEVAQQVSTIINTGGLCNTVINNNTSGALSQTSISITGDACNLGTHHIIYTATDDFSTPASTVVDITVIVTAGATVPTISQWGLMILCLLSLTIGMIFIYKKEKAFSFE